MLRGFEEELGGSERFNVTAGCEMAAVDWFFALFFRADLRNFKIIGKFDFKKRAEMEQI